MRTFLPPEPADQDQIIQDMTDARAKKEIPFLYRMAHKIQMWGKAVPIVAGIATGISADVALFTYAHKQVNKERLEKVQDAKIWADANSGMVPSEKQKRMIPLQEAIDNINGVGKEKRETSIPDVLGGMAVFLALGAFGGRMGYGSTQILIEAGDDMFASRRRAIKRDVEDQQKPSTFDLA